MKIPQRNYFMYKKIYETDCKNVNCSVKLEDFLKINFNDIISKSKKKVFTIYFICLQYPELYESFKINEQSPIKKLKMFYQNIFNLILFFVSFEPENPEEENKEDIQKEIMTYYLLFDHLNILFEKPYFIQSINGDIDYKSEELKQKIDENFKNQSNQLLENLNKILNEGNSLEKYNREFYNKFQEVLNNWITIYSNFDDEIIKIFIEKTNEKEIADYKKK